MAKYIIGAIALVLVAAGGYYWFVMKEAPAPIVETPVVQQPTTGTFATTTFSVVYPLTFEVNDSYAYDKVNPNKLIHGVQFKIPGTMATGTNLSADSYISVEQLPRANKCTGDIYVLDNVRPSTLSVGSTTFSVATTSDAGAGNFYEEMVFAVEGSKPCTAVRYFIHSTNVGNYPAGTVREFDRAGLLRAFDGIRNSLQLI